MFLKMLLLHLSWFNASFLQLNKKFESVNPKYNKALNQFIQIYAIKLVLYIFTTI